MLWFDRQFTFGLPPEMLPFYLERLEGTISRLMGKVKNCPEEILSMKADGKWSVKQNIGHLAEVDEISSRRIDEIRAGTPYLSPAVFDVRLDYNAQTVNEVLRYFTDARTKNLEKYKRLVESDLAKSSIHPRLKLPMTPVDLAWFDAEHDDHHAVRINEIISAFGSRVNSH